MRLLEREVAMGNPEAEIRLARLRNANGFRAPVLSGEDLATLPLPTDLCDGWGDLPEFAGHDSEGEVFVYNACPGCMMCKAPAISGILDRTTYYTDCIYGARSSTYRCGNPDWGLSHACRKCQNQERFRDAIETLRGLRAMAAMLGFVPTDVDPADKFGEWEAQMNRKDPNLGVFANDSFGTYYTNYYRWCNSDSMSF
jgi:hypothetical protein